MFIKDEEMILERKLKGPYPTESYLDNYKLVYDEEFNLIHTKDTITVEWELADINWFAGQHIEKYYPLWKQSNITREGGDNLTTMTTFIDSVRAWANQDPLPNPWDGSLEEIVP